MSNSVSVHVRRGDYAEAGNVSIHGLCGKDYYASAFALLEERIPHFRVFVFPDMPHDLEGFFETRDATFVRDTSRDVDMFLMSCCRHHIIANSTFSWWAAWLGSYPETITIAPKQWLAPEKQARTSLGSLFPKEWILL